MQPSLMNPLFYYVQLSMLLAPWLPWSPEVSADTSAPALPELLLSEPMINSCGLHDMDMRRAIFSTTGHKGASSSTALFCDGIRSAPQRPVFSGHGRAAAMQPSLMNPVFYYVQEQRVLPDDSKPSA
ncbi:hypothetical protein HPB50_002037 [Hyalomma asiaticum]|uniref:Uncharacterized protein n=1 Tax=Hyalomma asiaticum TaxID=266040 RepID=A0ACB7SB93_HYAAI|nr:hypothetical protein HPB50_002037 [Hyalomma asiaticum]